MPDNQNSEFFKLLTYICIGLITFISGLYIKFINALKGTDDETTKRISRIEEKVFDRLNDIDKRIERIDSRCEERMKGIEK